jgi:hypothetical protein
MSFQTLGLHDALLKAVAESGYETATEVQAQAIPAGLAGSRPDGLGQHGQWQNRLLSSCPRCKGILAARGDNNTRREKGKVAWSPRVGAVPHP